MNFFGFMVLGLAVWRLSKLISSEEGPWMILERFRCFVGISYGEDGSLIASSNIAKGFACIWCQSIWWGCIASVLWLILGESIVWIALPFAISALAIIVDKITE